MLTPRSNPEAGNWLRTQRERLRLSSRDVERLSYELALQRSNKQYYVSRSWVTDIERGKFRPSALKLRTLSIIYKGNYNEYLALFDFPIADIGKQSEGLLLPHTYLLDSAQTTERTIVAPTELRETMELDKTNLVARMFSDWEEIPIPFLERMNLRNALYGYIGKEDYTMFPIIRPASLVQIDPRQAKIMAANWHGEHDRPIYFFELRDRYVCSWCELNGNQLILVPSPQSGLAARHVRYPGDVDILGRVTGLTMPIAEIAAAPPRESQSRRGP